MNYKKKVAIIGVVGLPAKYGGFETLTHHLIDFIADDYDITVFCSSKSYSEKLRNYNGVSLDYINLKANGFQSIFYDMLSILKSYRKNDTLLILGVSGCVILPLIRLISPKVKIIVNIDGLEWKRDKWNKYIKRFLKFSEKIAVSNADEIIADNIVISNYVKKEYKIDNNFISYGSDHVTKESKELVCNKKYSFLNNKYALKVCRIEPENNIEIVLEAFSKFKHLNLVLIGNWDNSVFGRKMFLKYSNYDNLFLLEPIYNQKELNVLRSNCLVYVHGHSAGGTNPSLIEAMQLSLPVFAYSVDYNIETTQCKAKYFANTVDLIKLLNTIDNSDLENNALEMKRIASENYVWEKISSSYARLF